MGTAEERARGARLDAPRTTQRPVLHACRRAGAGGQARHVRILGDRVMMTLAPALCRGMPAPWEGRRLGPGGGGPDPSERAGRYYKYTFKILYRTMRKMNPYNGAGRCAGREYDRSSPRSVARYAAKKGTRCTTLHYAFIASN